MPPSTTPTVDPTMQARVDALLAVLGYRAAPVFVRRTTGAGSLSWRRGWEARVCLEESRGARSQEVKVSGTPDGAVLAVVRALEQSARDAIESKRVRAAHLCAEADAIEKALAAATGGAT